MRLTVKDLQRAITSAGDVAAFAHLYHSALGGSAPHITSRLDLELPLPALDTLMRPQDICLVDILNGRGLSNLKNKPPSDFDLTVVTAPASGKNVAAYIKNVIEQVQPDIVALNIDPLSLCADARYAFSLPFALGFSFTSEIRKAESREIFSKRVFSPAGLSTQVVLNCWARGISIVPCGKRPSEVRLTFTPSQGFVDLNYAETVRWESEVINAESELDSLPMQAGTDAREAAAKVGHELIRAANESQREQLADESCYFISRLMDVLVFQNARALKPRVLVISDLAHFHDINYLGTLLKDGVTDEIYTDVKLMPDTRAMVLDGVNQGYTENASLPSGGMSQMFLDQFEVFVSRRLNEELSQEDGLRLAVAIAKRTRQHPDIIRGISVRGSIAMIEVLRALVLIRGRLTRDTVGRAALITLSPRLRLKADLNAEVVIHDVLKEVFFDFTFESDSSESALRSIRKLSGEDILEKLGQMGQLPQESGSLKNTASAPIIIPENENNRDLLKKLEKMDFLKKGQNGQYSLTQKALQTMLDQLDKRLKLGEISPQEYQRQQAALRSRMQNINRPQFKMSSKELANTVMELIDAQDRQWNKDINFQTMRTYYHIKENSEGAEIGEEKSDYYSLQKLIDDLEKRKILAVATQSSGLLLTGFALDMLLKYFLEDARAVKGAQALSGNGKTFSSDRSQEVRRYSSGDAFRDIAVRPTLREIARQKHNLKDIRNSDLRVFLKQPRKPQTDIVICMDTSGSMGFHQKLMYARLVAAGLVQSAIREKNRVGLVAFNDSGQITIPLLGANKELLLNCIAGLNARGNTNIGEGIKSSARILFKDSGSNQKRIILISDGQPTAISENVFSKLKGRDEKDLTEESAILETRAASAKGILLSVIQIAGEGEANDKFVNNIVQAGKGKLRRIKGPDDLKGLMS